MEKEENKNNINIDQNQKLEKRDGFGIWNSDKIRIEAKDNSRILLMEVHMKI